MSQDPPPPGDPNLKPAEPELDAGEQARRRLAKREKRMAEIIEAKRQQEIKDQEARAEQKKREQPRMEKKESEESLKLFNQEPSTSQPSESKAEMKARERKPADEKKTRVAAPDESRQESSEERRIAHYQKQKEMEKQKKDAASSSAGQPEAANQEPDADSGSTSSSIEVVTQIRPPSPDPLMKKIQERIFREAQELRVRGGLVRVAATTAETERKLDQAGKSIKQNRTEQAEKSGLRLPQPPKTSTPSRFVTIRDTERPAIPPAVGAPPAKASPPTDSIPTHEDLNSRRRNKEHQLRSRFTELSEDESEPKEDSSPAPRRKSSGPCNPRELKKRPVPSDFSKGPQPKIAPISSQMRHVGSEAASSSSSTQKLDTRGSKPENVSQAQPVQAQKAVLKKTSTPVSSAPKTPATIQTTPVSKPTKPVAPSSFIVSKAPVWGPVVKQPPTQNPKLVPTTIPAAPEKDSRSDTSPSGQTAPTPQPTVKKTSSVPEPDGKPVTSTVVKPKAAPTVQHVAQPASTAGKKVKAPTTVASNPEPKQIVKTAQPDKKKSDSQAHAQAAAKPEAPSSSIVPKGPVSEVEETPTQNPKRVPTAIPSAPQKDSRSDTAPSIRPVPTPQPTVKKGLTAPKQDPKPVAPSVEPKAAPTVQHMAQPAPPTVQKAKVPTVVASSKVAPPTQQQNLSKFAMATRRSLGELDFKQMAIDVLHVTSRKQRGDFRHALTNVRDRLMKDLTDLEKIDIQVVLDRLDELDQADSGSIVEGNSTVLEEDQSEKRKRIRKSRAQRLAEAESKGVEMTDEKFEDIYKSVMESFNKDDTAGEDLIPAPLMRRRSCIPPKDTNPMLESMVQLKKLHENGKPTVGAVLKADVAKKIKDAVVREQDKTLRRENSAQKRNRSEKADEPTEIPSTSVEAPLTENPSTTTEAPPTKVPSKSTEAPPTEVPSKSTEAPPTEVPSKSTEAPPTENPSKSTEAPPTEEPTSSGVPSSSILAKLIDEETESAREENQNVPYSGRQGMGAIERINRASPPASRPPEPVSLGGKYPQYRYVGGKVVKISKPKEKMQPKNPGYVPYVPPKLRHLPMQTQEKPQEALPAESVIEVEHPQIEDRHSPEPMEPTEQKSPTPEKEKTPERIAEEEQKDGEDMNHEDGPEDFQQLLADNEEKQGDVSSPKKADSVATKRTVREIMENIKDPTWEEIQERDKFAEDDVESDPVSDREDPELKEYEELYSSGDEEDDSDDETIMTRAESRDTREWISNEDNDQEVRVDILPSDHEEEEEKEEEEEEESEMVDVEEPELIGLAESPQMEERISPEPDRFSPLLESEVPYVAEEVILETEESYETRWIKQRNAQRQRDLPQTSRRETEYMKKLTAKAFGYSDEDSDEEPFEDSDSDYEFEGVESDIDEKLAKEIGIWEEKKAAEEEEDKKSNETKPRDSFEELEKLVTQCAQIQEDRRRRRYDSDGSDFGELSDSSFNADFEQVKAMYEREKEKREINSSKPPREKLMEFGDRCVERYQRARKLALEYKKVDKNEEKLAEMLEGKKEMEKKKRAPRGKKDDESKVKQQRRKPNEPDERDELEKDIERAQKQEAEMKKGVKMVLTEISKDPKIAERQCELCFGVFVNKNKRERHMKTHTDQIDANCDICGAPMKFSYNLVQHLKKCAQKLTIPCDEKELQQYYPRFIEQFNQFRADNLSDLPDLPADFKFDDMGFIVGSDDHIPFSYSNYEFKRVLKNHKKN